jgi:hypothetical protein
VQRWRAAAVLAMRTRPQVAACQMEGSAGERVRQAWRPDVHARHALTQRLHNLLVRARVHAQSVQYRRTRGRSRAGALRCHSFSSSLRADRAQNSSHIERMRWMDGFCTIRPKQPSGWRQTQTAARGRGRDSGSGVPCRGCPAVGGMRHHRSTRLRSEVRRGSNSAAMTKPGPRSHPL